MAILFARLQYVKRSAGQSACHKAAYNGRAVVQDLRQGKTYNYAEKDEDTLYHAVLLPKGVSEKYTDLNALWNTVEAIEKRYDSQVAKEMVLALPDDAAITLEDRIALTRGFVQKHFVDKGIICQVDIHGPDGEKGCHSRESGNPENRAAPLGSRFRGNDTSPNSVNHHAHILMPTRPCKGETFGLKARHLDVDIRGGRVIGTDKQWGRLWAVHQNDYFKEKGLDLQVDPIGVVPQIHLGPTRMRGKALHLVAENEALIDTNARYAQDERLVMGQLLQKESTFTRQTLDRFVEKHVEERSREEFTTRFWGSKELVLVGQDRYTSKAVLAAARHPRVGEDPSRGGTMDPHLREDDGVVRGQPAPGSIGGEDDKYHHPKEANDIQSLLTQWFKDYQQNPQHSFLIVVDPAYVQPFTDHIQKVLKSRGDSTAAVTVHHTSTGLIADHIYSYAQKSKHLGIDDVLHTVCDRFLKAHDFYTIDKTTSKTLGVLITDRLEDAYLKGYRTLYREDQDRWPDLSGVNVRTSCQHKDLEPFLRNQNVAQCLLLDAPPNDRMLIAPEDRLTLKEQAYDQAKDR